MILGIIGILYLILIFRGAFKLREGFNFRKENLRKYSGEKVIFTGEFSNKAYNIHYSFLVISVILLATLYLFSYKKMILSTFDFTDYQYKLINIVLWWGFLSSAFCELYLLCITIGVSHEFLIITNDKIYGTCCEKESTFTYQPVLFEIQFSDIEEVLALKGEKELWIRSEKLVIITKLHKFQLLHLLDGNEVKSVIEKRIAENDK